MGAFKCDTDALNNKVNTNLKNGRNSLDDGANILASISIPSSFSLSGMLSAIPSTIRNNGEKVNNLQKWVSDVINKFTGAEKANNNAISSLNNSIAEIDLSAGIDDELTIESKATFLEDLEESFNNLVEEFLENNEIAESTNANITDNYETTPSLIDTIGSEIKSIAGKIDKGHIISNVLDKTQTAVCSTFSAVSSIGKGIVEFLGAFIDTTAIIGTTLASIITLIADVVYYIDKAPRPTFEGFTNYIEDNSTTSAMWEKVMGFVSTSFVENAWNNFYENNILGQYINEHTVGIFKQDGIGCDILSGIGYISGIVVATIATLGIAGVGAGASAGAGTFVGSSTSTTTFLSSALASVSAFGKYTGESWAEDKKATWKGIEEAFKNNEISKEDYEEMKKIRNLSDEEWKSLYDEYLTGNISLDQIQSMRQIREMPENLEIGKNLESGIAYGGLNALWEGAQWLVGGFLGELTAGLGKVGTSMRISVDSIFNTLDTPFRSLIIAATTGKSFGEAFEEKGGWLSVLSDFSIGLIGSAGGELFDVIRKNINWENYVLEGLTNKDIPGVAKILYEKTPIGYDPDFYRKTQFELVDRLKGILGEEEAALRVSSLLEYIIYNERGGIEQIATIDGIKICTLKNSNAQNFGVSLENLKDWIKNMPDKVKQYVNTINVYDTYNSADVYWQWKYKEKDFKSAMTGGNGEINIYTVNQQFTYFIHESGHCFDSVYNISNSQEWINSMKLDEKINGNVGVTPYATQSFKAAGTRKEDFAESIMLYVLQPENFKVNFPNRWNILNNILQLK